ncbi:MAG TPA: hypothetical protein PK198_26025 [Saprospiraceae bacterium]|nr:hypothetical protein [Saprospiraceae bacterium]HRK81730.1 hypothetical protein [Saprospiraceae bacterium]
MLKFIFRLLFVALGLWITYTFGRDAVEPVLYRLSGTTVEGRIIGFLAGRKSPSVQPEPTAIRKGRRIARRPVFRYPTAVGATDSLDGRSSTGGFLIFGHFDLHEQVTVVMPAENPQNAHIFSLRLIGMAFVVALFGLFLIWMGITGKG